MADDQIPTEALEAGNRAQTIHDHAVTEVDGEWWWFCPDLGGDQLHLSPIKARDAVRAHVLERILAAAAPHLIAEGRRRAAEAIRSADIHDWPGGREYEVRGCQEAAARIAEGGTDA